MRICFLCPDLGIPVDGIKGASSHIRGFVGALSSLGHDVSVYTSCPVKNWDLDVPATQIPLPKMIQGISQDEPPRVFRALRHVLNNASIEKVLEEIIDREQPDLIYERYSPFGVAGSIITKQCGLPHVLEVNAPLAEQGKLYRKQALQDASELLETTAFNQTSLIVTLTYELRRWLIGLGIPPKKIIVRPCAVDEHVFKPEGQSKRDKFEGKFVIGFVGSLKPWHDMEILANSFRELAKEPDNHLLLVGDGPMKNIFEDLSDELPGRVTLTGGIPQKDVPAYIRAMDIAVAPYPKLDLFYFSPLKVFEYMAMGKAVVATGIGQLNALICHGENGWLIPPENTQEFIQAINKLKNDPKLRDSLGIAAAKEIRAHHTWKERTATFMDNLIDHPIIKEHVKDEELLTTSV